MGQGGRVRGKRREMNRVAAKRHREKNKDRLKSVSRGRTRLRRRHVERLTCYTLAFKLEKRKTWLDTALVEYEKSNKRLSETLDRLKRENGMVSPVGFRDGICSAADKPATPAVEEYSD